MPQLTLCLVRHGETEANKAGILQGHNDFPLTEKGEKEAIAVGQALKHITWDAAYSSDLPRASRTCRILLEQSVGKGTGPTETSLVREVCYGVRERLPTSTTVEEARAIVAQQMGIDEKDVMDDAELPEQVRGRQKVFLQQLRGDFAEASSAKVLLVSHGGFIKRFLASFCGHTIPHIRNCSVSSVTVRWEADSPDMECTAVEGAVDWAEHCLSDEVIPYPFLQ